MIFRFWITEMGRTDGTDRRTDVAQCGPSGRPAQGLHNHSMNNSV